MSSGDSPDLFDLGLHYFKTQKYFEAHDAWEELWSDRGLQDRAFIQGLIQLAVAIVHLENNMTVVEGDIKFNTAGFNHTADA